jgi:hypothetical protein
VQVSDLRSLWTPVTKMMDATILEGTAGIIMDPGEWKQVNNAFMEKFVNPHSGARAFTPQTDNLYRVDVKRIMCWEYGVIATRTVWNPDTTSQGGQVE